MGVKIRVANEDDLPAIFGLVNELALYEKEPESVKTTLDDFVSNFCEGTFFSEVAEDEHGEVVGMTIAYIGFSTWNGRMLFLEDFYVKETHRRQGIGKLLFESMIQQARARGVQRMKWQVLDWNQPAIDFYEKYNPVIQRGWLNVNLFESDFASE